MKTETIVYCVVALILGMLLAHMLKNVCGCKVVEGHAHPPFEAYFAQRILGCATDTSTSQLDDNCFTSFGKD